MLNVMLNAARNRAIQSGRSAGVWIEKMNGLPEASVSVYQAAVPEPYGGDFYDSGIEAYSVPDWTDANRKLCSYFVNVVCPSRRSLAGNLAARNQDAWSSSSSTSQQLVRSGDRIRINGSGIYTLYQLASLDGKGVASLSAATSAAGTSGAVFNPATGWIIGVFSNKYTIATNSGSMGRMSSGGYTWLNPFPPTLGSKPFITYNSTTTHAGYAVPYQILRSPQKLAAGAIQMPDGVVIDLNYSEINNMPLYPRVLNITTNSSTYYYGAPGDAIGGLSNHANPLGQSPSIQNGLNPDGTNPDMQPVIITFNSVGIIDLVYSQHFNVSLGQWIYEPYQPTGLIHLLVGKSERVPCNPDTTSVSSGVSPQYNNNYTDLDNFWVSVNPRSGTVNSAPNKLVNLAATNGIVAVSSAIQTAHDYGERAVSMGGK